MFLIVRFPYDFFQKIVMGNCVPELKGRKTARENFDFNIQGSAKAPLQKCRLVRMFQIRTWPLSNTFDLKDSQNCYERFINASLCEGERIEINLQSQPQNLEYGFRSNIQNYHIRCEISKKNKTYTIRFPNQQECKQLWKFIGKWAEIREGDTIRMGNSKYRLTKLINSLESDSYKSLKNIDESLTFMQNGIQSNRCRICLSRANSVEDPLISPCKCTGSIGYVHLKCLSNWLFDLNIDESAYISIRVNKSMCQLCKTDITGTEQYAKMRDILMGNANNVPSPYAIFQVYQTQQQKGKNYFVMSFNTKKSYTFGRSKHADICDKNDRCISKFNSQIKYQKKRLLVRDCDSTHGTFIKIDQSLTLDAQNREQNVSYRNMIIKAKFSPSSQMI